MKKILLLLLLLSLSGCISAQETTAPQKIIKGDYIVTDVIEGKATLTNSPRRSQQLNLYKAPSEDFQVGREYYVEMRITDCGTCFHKQVEIIFKTTSARQNALDRAKKNNTQ